MTICPEHTRRRFIQSTLAGGVAVVAARWGARYAMGAAPSPVAAPPVAPSPASGVASRVALTAGNDRADNIFQGMKAFSKEIAAAIGDKRILIKPNNVSNTSQLAATDAKQLEGILEFLKSIGKTANIIIAESGAGGSTMDGFVNFGYDKVAAKYGVKLVDFDKEGFETMSAIDETDVRPHPVRVSSLLLDPNTYVISAAKFKTHNAVVATLSLKNIVMGAPLKLGAAGRGAGGGRGGRGGGGGGGGSDKPTMHGGGAHGINFNLTAFAARLHPHLAVIDGYEGMEGNGPISGTAVDHRVAVISPDWLAADRVGVELMGIDFTKIGYLNFCGQSGMGQTDLSKIEILGPAIKDHVKTYKLSSNIDSQLQWLNPPGPGTTGRG